MTQVTLFAVLPVILLIFFIVYLVRRRQHTSERERSRANNEQPQSPITRADAEKFIHQHFETIIHEEFPDTPDINWSIRDINHAATLIFVECDPGDNQYGYGLHKLAFLVDSVPKPICVASYVEEGGKFTLLATARGAPDDLPRELL